MPKDNDLLERIFATTHLCIAYLDLNLDFIRVNHAYADAGGHSPEFFCGKNHFALYPGENIEAVFRRALASGEPYTIYAHPFEYPDHPEKGVTYWDWTVHPLRDIDGAVDGLLFTLLDVTERTRAIRELERRTALAQLLASLARTTNQAATPQEAMRICLAKIFDIGGWTLGRLIMTEELRGDFALPVESDWHVLDCAHYEEFIRSSQDISEFQEAGQFAAEMLREKGPVWIVDMNDDARKSVRRSAALSAGLRAAFSFPVMVQDKTVAILEFFADTPRRFDAAQVAAAETIAAQITHRIERSAAEAEQALLAAIVESSNDAILIRGPDRTIAVWNAAAETLFGWTAQEAIGQPIELIVPPERAEVLSGYIERASLGEPWPPVESSHLRKDGVRIPTQVTISPVKDPLGKVVAHSLTVRDMTELKRKSEVLLAYATQQRVLWDRLRSVEDTERYAISRELHDRIGQGLSTLRLLLGSLRARLSPESLQVVERQLEDMQGLLKSIIVNVRDIMADLRPPVLDDYGLLAALRQLVTEFSQRSGIKAELSGVDLQPRLPSRMETEIFRIIQEALNNIAKHAEAEYVEISLYADSDRVVLDIMDDGIGFDMNQAPPDKHHWGLSTMRERAESVNMTFHLESVPGFGTHIVLKAERAAP